MPAWQIDGGANESSGSLASTVVDAYFGKPAWRIDSVLKTEALHRPITRK